MSQLKLCIFDMGGVMVDGHDVAPKIAERLGVDVAELRPMLRAAGFDDLHDGRISPLQYWARLREQTGLELPGDPWGDLFTPVRHPAMYALVERLKESGVPVVAGTNTIDVHYAIHLRNGDYDVFDRTYASNLMRISKPDPAFWQHILQVEGVRPEEAVFVDDLQENVDGAAAVGLHAVLLQSQEQAIGEVERLFGLGST